MTQERTTSLRILQTNKKKTLSPVIYLLIGFLSGIIVAALFFFIFASDVNNSAPSVPQTIEETETVQTATKATVQNNEVEVNTPNHHETTESVEDNNFAQPGSNDLNKFFQRTPPPAAPAPNGQHVSPFANEPNTKPTTVTSVKVPHSKNETIAPPTNKVVAKPVPPATKPAPAKTAEAEVEAPEATVQIKVTQKPFAVNELK
ncbi:hypothetical protein GCM10025882_19690 [Acinetobacter gyllenbergii]|uniref:Uncharacterized protein n=1 Tax=Acinetobacter gyllenbergii CIP 110306 = MTCC 11365 TaxID=1217657 RepID=A0A829HGP3_9GAMM|nr:hypothetical protein [Acinetobacter gyllenbergii]EPF79658.1 hypothetical protein F957_02524 [Acinetobacter gyllenbergii CIP 110306 = MTCC 11365]EPH32911.1 putative exported protein [Acinetobacter gyllenbergii CIP 110306 = MTCC 11365]ESK50153.1 hypothetical protein F987_01699 [Acinetobacter gyllenbergii NIPH 230]OBY76001.1 hypothetical protein NG55_04855 [Acinetobacter gyllenbergii]GMA11544.1 hypothetical protein GCM10025882_19690 [Acinetobacter gyllenbergii]